ncbi:MAG TPA: glycosyltransferase family 4 protein [Bacteroidia bacterium]|nr:glycosyltransferase family 4 protein [Bacteroidia bacterium]HRH08117.1 glycosyltransferase family 4 protein [Bacteroidia bacterium]
MKITIIGSAFPLRGGGISTFNERLCLAYLERGDTVKIVSFSLQYPSFLFPGKSQFSAEAPPAKISIETSINSINPLNWIRIGLKIKKEKADVVIIRYWIPFMAPCLGTIARIIRLNRHSKVISITDNILPHEKRIGDRILSKFYVKSVDGFITMSRSVLSELMEFDLIKPKLFCSHPLYDNFGEMLSKESAKKSLGLTPSENYILFFGFIRDYKGLDLLLQALSESDVLKLKIKLIIAGEYYTDPKPYRDLIKQLNLENSVIERTNFIPNNEVSSYFCAADLVVQPYKTATQSGVTQIAYHFNKPMIVTNVGGLPEMIPNGKVGYVVNPDSGSIAEALINFYKLNKEEEFSKNASEEKKKYSWNSMIDTISQLGHLIQSTNDRKK